MRVTLSIFASKWLSLFSWMLRIRKDVMTHTEYTKRIEIIAQISRNGRRVKESSAI